MSDRRFQDADARRAAATDFETNLVVEAGAGTGKTSLLVERILNAVGSGRVEITRLAAITFTEKAAGEMRARISEGFEGLRAVAGDEVVADPPGESSRAFDHLIGEAGLSPADVGARALRALEEMDRATVVTVHAFCSDLLRAHPVEADVDPDFTVDTGQHTTRLREEHWERFAASELGPQAPRPALWRQVLDRFALADVESLASALAGFGIPVGTLAPPFSAAATNEMLQTLAGRVLPELEALIERAGGMTTKSADYFQTMRRALTPLAEGDLDAFRRCIADHAEVAARVEKGNPLKANKKLTGVAPEEFDRLFGRLLRLARHLMRADDAPFAPLLELVAPFADRLRERLLEQGLVGFDALLTLTRDLLRAHPDVRRALKRRFDMLLVDEFQDIDPLQYEIVLLLAQQVEEGAANPLDSPLEPGRLFVVGDPKQSIYRFRGADYDAYRAAVDRIVQQGGRRLDLVSNFRSLPGVIESVNRLFDDTPTWRPSPYQPPYTPIRAVRDTVEPPCVELWTVTVPGGARAERRRRSEAQSIAAEIERLVAGRTLDYEDVTILFRAFTNIGIYLRALRERGIPFVVDGGREFLRRPEVAQLMATLRTLSQPLDQAALLAFLRSPTGGVSDGELARYAASGSGWSWRARVDAEQFPRIADRFGLLERLSREMLHLPADAAIRRVVDRTQMLPLGAAAFEGAQRAANLRKLSEAAGELARDGRLSLDQVVEALREGRLADIETDSPLADDRADAVRITSIHRMKGLENRWIFLPDLSRGEHRGPQLRDNVAVAWTPDRRPIPALKIDRLCSTSWVWLDDESALHGDAEETRVLYVALTRARDRLVLVAGQSDRSAKWIAALDPWGYVGDAPPGDGALLCDGRVLHRVVEPPPSPGARNVPRSADAEEARRRYRSTVEALQASAAPAFRSPSMLEAEAASRSPAGGNRVSATRSRDLSRAVGIVVHRFLEEGLGETGDRAARVETLCARVARDEGLAARELIAASLPVLDNFAGSSLADELRGLDCVGREMPMLLRDDDGAVYRGSIDLLYRDADGELVVADYKTDPETDEQELRRRYAGQLGVYAEAVRQTYRLEVRPRTELLMVRLARRVALD